MNFSLTNSRLKPGLLALLTIAALLAFALGAGSAKAAGGISTGDGGGDGSGSRSGGDAKYERLWDRTSAKDKRWARNTAKCESGGDPNAIGGGGRYRGAFQFMKATWRTSPKSPGGDPIDYSYTTQAVVAVKLKNRDGAGHWPVCG